jgi:hypothetical protein
MSPGLNTLPSVQIVASGTRGKSDGAPKVQAEIVYLTPYARHSSLGICPCHLTSQDEGGHRRGEADVAKLRAVKFVPDRPWVSNPA